MTASRSDRFSLRSTCACSDFKRSTVEGAVAKRKAANARRKAMREERARRVLGTESGTLTLYSAYIIVLIRLVVILFHGEFPHLG